MHFVLFFFSCYFRSFSHKAFFFYRGSIFFENSLYFFLHSYYLRASVSSLGEPTNKTENRLCSQLFWSYIYIYVGSITILHVYFLHQKKIKLVYLVGFFLKLKISLVLVTIILVQTYDTYLVI